MPVKFDAGKIRANAKTFIREATDRDLSERADRVVAAAAATTAFKDVSGELRKSIHKEKFPNPNFPGYRIVADAVNKKGEGYGYWVEMGHPTPGSKFAKAFNEKGELVRGEQTKGGYVDPRPFMLPALQAAKD